MSSSPGGWSKRRAVGGRAKRGVRGQVGEWGKGEGQVGEEEEGSGRTCMVEGEVGSGGRGVASGYSDGSVVGRSPVCFGLGRFSV